MIFSLKCRIRLCVGFTRTIPVTHSHGHVHCIETRIWLNGRISTTLWKTHEHINFINRTHFLNKNLKKSIDRFILGEMLTDGNFWPQMLFLVKDSSSPNKISTQRTWFPWTAYRRGAPPFWNPQKERHNRPHSLTPPHGFIWQQEQH